MADNVTTGFSTGNGPDKSASQGSTPQFQGAGVSTSQQGNLAQTPQDYAGKVSDVASHAKDYVSDKVSVVADKIKEFGNKDLGEMAESAKEFARKNPGQAILISAAAGLLLGLIVRGRR